MKGMATLRCDMSEPDNCDTVQKRGHCPCTWQRGLLTWTRTISLIFQFKHRTLAIKPSAPMTRGAIPREATQVGSEMMIRVSCWLTTCFAYIGGVRFECWCLFLCLCLCLHAS